MNKITQYHLHKANPEKLQFQVYDLNAYRNKNSVKAGEPHSHSYYQIIWFFEAGGTHTVDFNSFPIRKHTVLFISKDQVHFFDNNLNVTGWLIHFNESFFMHSDVDIFLKFKIFNTNKNPYYAIDPKTEELGFSYLHLIQEELNSRDSFGNEEVIRYLLKSFLITLERLQKTAATNRIGATSQYELQFFMLKELIELNYIGHKSVSYYAKALHISSKTLSNITNRMVQKSPSQLIAERTRLEAKRLLAYTSFQVSEIAFRLGFEDVSYFIKYFKRNVGRTPKVYRQDIEANKINNPMER